MTELRHPRSTLQVEGAHRERLSRVVPNMKMDACAEAQQSTVCAKEREKHTSSSSWLIHGCHI